MSKRKPTSTKEATPVFDVQRVELASLVQDPDNANDHPDENVAAIHASLVQFGQVEPLIFQKGTRKLIGGNARAIVMMSLGWSTCYAVELDLDDASASALGLALNRAPRLARWNASKVLELVGNLEAFSPDLAKVVGFNPEELRMLTNVAAKEERDAMDHLKEAEKQEVEPREVSFTVGGSKASPDTAKAVADEIRWMAQAVNAMAEPVTKPAVRDLLEKRMRAHRDKAEQP